MKVDLTKLDLKKGAAWVEDGIIVLSGPALAISGIIAGVDLVTGGNILKSIWWLSLVWAITLLLTLDFQVLALGVRAHRVYVSKEKKRGQKFWEILFAILIAGAISAVSIQMQSIIARVNAEGVSIDMAAVQLGINTIWLIWERSTLVLVLIFMSGWLREHDNKVVDTPVQAVEVIPQVAGPSLEELLDKLDSRYMMRMAGMQATLERTLERTAETVRVTIAEQITNPNMPAIALVNAPARDEIAEHAQSLVGSQFVSKQQDVARVLRV